MYCGIRVEKGPGFLPGSASALFLLPVKPQAVIEGVGEVLAGAEVPFGRLNTGDKSELDKN